MAVSVLYLHQEAADPRSFRGDIVRNRKLIAFDDLSPYPSRIEEIGETRPPSSACRALLIGDLILDDAWIFVDVQKDIDGVFFAQNVPWMHEL